MPSGSRQPARVWLEALRGGCVGWHRQGNALKHSPKPLATPTWEQLPGRIVPRNKEEQFEAPGARARKAGRQARIAERRTSLYTYRHGTISGVLDGAAACGQRRPKEDRAASLVSIQNVCSKVKDGVCAPLSAVVFPVQSFDLTRKKQTLNPHRAKRGATRGRRSGRCAFPDGVILAQSGDEHLHGLNRFDSWARKMLH